MRRKKSYWYLFRMLGDMAVYSQCCNCGWASAVSSYGFLNEDDDCACNFIRHIPKYCQECGSKNRLYNGYVVYLHDENGKLISGKEKSYPHRK